MQALGIVKGIDVLEHAEAGLFEIVEAVVVGPLVFERGIISLLCAYALSAGVLTCYFVSL